ncbi:MAG: OmpH family outer membrane protein [Vicinamibacterales bacterium]
MTLVTFAGLRRVLSVTALAAAMVVPAFAQTAPKPAAPAAPKPAAPAAPKPAAPAPAAASAPAPAPVVPFPDGARIAFIDIQRIIAESKEGQSASGKVKALNDRKVAELNERNKTLQSDQQKLQSGAGVLSDSAREELQRKIERQNTDIERATQDAQKELQDLQQQLQLDFQRKLNPVLAEVAQERGLHLVFSAGDAGLAWAHAGLDITADVIKRFDSKK